MMAARSFTDVTTRLAHRVGRTLKPIDISAASILCFILSRSTLVAP